MMKTVVEEEERNSGDEAEVTPKPEVVPKPSTSQTLGFASEDRRRSKSDGGQPRRTTFENVILRVMRRPSIVGFGNSKIGSKSSSNLHGSKEALEQKGAASKIEVPLLASKPPVRIGPPVPQNQLMLRRSSGMVTFNPAQINIHQKKYILGLLQGSNNSIPELCRDVGPSPEKPEETKKSSANENDTYITGLSILYAKLIIVLGIAFPVAEVLSSNVPTHYYQGFYLFLYLGSLAFMTFMYMTLLKDRALYKIIKSSLDVEEDEFNRLRTMRKHKQLFLNPVRYGSFYLRLGAVAFGIGSMVYSGLEFGRYFEMNESQCRNLVQAVTPVARMILTLAQMQFIFINSKQMEMSKSRSIARFGLMHLIATNLCEWLNVIVEETKHEIIHLGHAESHEEAQDATTNSYEKHVIHNREAEHDIYECQRASVIGSLVQDASPFLFPCTIEYSLICAVIMYEMWKDVKKSILKEDDEEEDLSEKGTALDSSTNNGSEEQKSDHHFSVDCSNAHKGLFSGILILVMTIISLIMFFVMEKDRSYHSMAAYEVNVCELLLYCIGIVAVVLGCWQMRHLKFKRNKKDEGFGLDNTLLMWAQSGVYFYCMFSIIASYFMIDHNSPGGFITEVLSLIQSTFQTAFILDANFRRTDSSEQQKNKPGRQIITFLLVTNMALWLMNTLQKNRAEFRPTHLDFYGMWAWTIITHVSMPLSIFYRFHSTICLFEIWKNAYKFKQIQQRV